MEVKDELMVVPLLISLVDRKCLLLGVHVQQQVGNAVAVAVLIIIPGWRKGGKENELVSVFFSDFLFSMRGWTGHVENSPGNELDKVVIEGDASTSIKDGGMGITDEIRGHHLANTKHTTRA